MKLKYFFPLIVFIVLTILACVFLIKDNLSIIIQFSSFLLFFSMTYFFAIKETIKNKAPVVKIAEKSPFLFPILFFSIPSVVLTIIFIKRDFEIITQFFSVFIFCLIIYSLGIFFLKRDLKKDFEEAESKRIARSIKAIESKKKLLLINPVNQNRVGLTVNPSSVFPPLGLGIVAALTPRDFYIKLIDENFEVFQYEDADLVAITAFTSSVNRAYEIASQYKQKNIPVIMGGIHASMMPEEVLKHVDCVVIGEAEDVWQEVIIDFANGSLKKIYKGAHLELKNMIIPQREIFSEKYLFASIQTSRGCPMDCNFCSVTAFNGKKFRQRPVDEVLDELENIPQEHIFFIDDNILGYGKDSEQRIISLFKGMIERKLDKVWFCQASLNFGTNEEVLKLAAKSGCKMVFIGLESADPEELKEMNKKMNLKLSYEKVFKNINKYGIAVLGAFIYGSDYETSESMVRKTNYILKNRIDVIDITTLTPLPGTKLFRKFQEENRLVYSDFPKDWDKYDMTELTYKLKRMEREEFKETMNRCMKRFYATGTLYEKFLKTLIHSKSIETAMWAYSSNLNFRNVAFTIDRTNDNSP